MTREEEILKASKIYSEYKYNQTDFENGFINGAKWADNNPTQDIINLNDVWHDASEEPEDANLEILCQDKYGCWTENRIDIPFSYKDWNTYTESEHIVRWAYIKDLLPKQFGNSEQLKGGEK